MQRFLINLDFSLLVVNGKDACLRSPVSYCDLSRVQLVPCTPSEGNIAEELARHNILRVTVTIFKLPPIEGWEGHRGSRSLKVKIEVLMCVECTEGVTAAVAAHRVLATSSLAPAGLRPLHDPPLFFNRHRQDGGEHVCARQEALRDAWLCLPQQLDKPSAWSGEGVRGKWHKQRVS